jgi:hypothetical protein
VVGLLVLLVRRLAGNYVVDQLSTAASDELAVERSWEILTRLLADAGWAAIVLGLVVVIGVWLVGTSSRASVVRGWLAPYLRRAEVTYGVAAFLFLLLLLWSPISYIQRLSTIVVLLVLGAVGVELLRRRTAREFPDAVPGGFPSMRGLGTSSAPSQADELERLVRLRAEGMLTDDEFAAAKARALAMDTSGSAP